MGARHCHFEFHPLPPIPTESRSTHHGDHKDVKLGMQMRCGGGCFIPVRVGTIWIVGRVTEISHRVGTARCLLRVSIRSDSSHFWYAIYVSLSLTRETSCDGFLYCRVWLTSFGQRSLFLSSLLEDFFFLEKIRVCSFVILCNFVFSLFLMFYLFIFDFCLEAFFSCLERKGKRDVEDNPWNFLFESLRSLDCQWNFSVQIQALWSSPSSDKVFYHSKDRNLKKEVS